MAGDRILGDELRDALGVWSTFGHCESGFVWHSLDILTVHSLVESGCYILLYCF